MSNIEKLNILVTGGAGVMGRRLVKELCKQGHKVRILSLPNDPLLKDVPKEVEIYTGDITNLETVKDVCKDIHTVYHLAAVILSSLNESIFEKVNCVGTENMLRLAEKSCVEHFVYASSASVNYPKTNSYAISKQKSENFIKESAVPYYTIIRPTLAYEDGGAEEFMGFVDYLKKYPIIPFIGSGKAKKRPVFVEDIVKGMASIAGNSKAYKKTYNLSGGEVLTLNEMAKRLLIHMGNQKTIIHIPIFICRIMATISMAYAKLVSKPSKFNWQTISGVSQDADLDPKNAINDLDYNPRSFSEGIKELNSLKDCLTRKKE